MFAAARRMNPEASGRWCNLWTWSYLQWVQSSLSWVNDGKLICRDNCFKKKSDWNFTCSLFWAQELIKIGGLADWNLGTSKLTPEALTQCKSAWPPGDMDPGNIFFNFMSLNSMMILDIDTHTHTPTTDPSFQRCWSLWWCAWPFKGKQGLFSLSETVSVSSW